MENNNVEDGELFKFFREKSDGVGYTFDQLYKVCTGYTDTFALSREVSALVRLKLIEKREKHYFYVDPTAEIKKFLTEHPDAIPDSKLAEEVIPAPKPEPRVIRAAPKTPAPKEEVAPAPLVETMSPWGDLIRGSAVTPIALTFYFNQKDAFTTNDLHGRTGVNKQVASQVVRRMLDGGYIEHAGGGPRSSSYRWTGRFRYPFPESRQEDISWRSTRIEKMPPAAAVEPAAPQLVKVGGPTTVVSIGQDHHLQALDAVIQRYEHELDALRAARSAYITKTQAAA